MDTKHPDAALIRQLGGPTKVARMLGWMDITARCRVQNWLKRGIPAHIKVQYPEIFMAGWPRKPKIRGKDRRRQARPTPSTE